MRVSVGSCLHETAVISKLDSVTRRRAISFRSRRFFVLGYVVFLGAVIEKLDLIPGHRQVRAFWSKLSQLIEALEDRKVRTWTPVDTTGGKATTQPTTGHNEVEGGSVAWSHFHCQSRLSQGGNLF